MNTEQKPTQVKAGQFPFPLNGGTSESRYMTWLRNHSNYMIENGLTDFLRIIAVLVRGIFLNLMILMPYFLVFAAALALLNIIYAEPAKLKFNWADEAEESTAVETLHVTLRSNLGRTETLDVPFDRTTSDAISDSMGDLLNVVRGGGDFFDELSWSLEFDEMLIVHKASKRAFAVTGRNLAQGDLVLDLHARSPLMLSEILLGLAAVFVIFWPIIVRMSRVSGYKRAQRTGYYGSVKRRDWWERFFGKLLLLMICIALVESFPLLTSWFHTLRQVEVAVAVPTVATLVGGIVAANRLLPALGGWAKTLGVFVVGALGLAIPLVIVLFVVDFLVYQEEILGSSSDWAIYVGFVLAGLPALFTLLLFITWVIGFFSFSWIGHAKLLGLMLGMAAFTVVVVGLTIYFASAFPRYLFVYYTLAIAAEIWIYCWLAVDVNQTSINGLYRDRLASAYLIGIDTEGDIDIEKDINLQEICNYDAGSTAPYHLINTALNLQATEDIGVRDRNSDFFVFSKKFIGSDRTGYCRSEHMESVYPQMDLGTAMAISAAAASPNMGRSTNPLMVAFLTLLNIRLGFWVPHPDRLEKYLCGIKETKKERETSEKFLCFAQEVFIEEARDIGKRRLQVYGNDYTRSMGGAAHPSTELGLMGIAFSGGGIRSATFNLGLLQGLENAGVFIHADYLSTVSGGGYLGSSISTLMRYKSSPNSKTAGVVELRRGQGKTVVVKPKDGPEDVYEYAAGADLAKGIKDGAQVEAGQRLLQRAGNPDRDRFVSLMDSFSWRVRPSALWHEVLSKLDEEHDWINLSDGGHIENMASIELLRRRCKYIILGDGDADPEMHFFGLATLIRYAQIDLEIRIDMDVEDIRLNRDETDLVNFRTSESHWAIGTIHYPADEDNPQIKAETGYLLYFKSSVTGDEGEVINEYRNRNPDFPHEPTADQLFDEGQFEAYRALGQHIAEQALAQASASSDKLTFDEVETWITKDLRPDGDGEGSS